MIFTARFTVAGHCMHACEPATLTHTNDVSHQCFCAHFSNAYYYFLPLLCMCVWYGVLRIWSHMLTFLIWLLLLLAIWNFSLHRIPNQYVTSALILFFCSTVCLFATLLLCSSLAAPSNFHRPINIYILFDGFFHPGHTLDLSAYY